MAAYDPDGDTVITAGSMSKAYWAGLRIGWIRASPTLVQRLGLARASVDMSSPIVEQLIAAELLADADALLAAHRAALRGRRDVLAAALEAALPEWRFERPRGGLVAVGRARTRRAAARSPRSPTVTACASRAGPRFGIDGAFERFVRVPYALPEAQLTTAVERLSVAWRSVADDGTAGTMEPLSMVA